MSNINVEMGIPQPEYWPSQFVYCYVVTQIPVGFILRVKKCNKKVYHALFVVKQKELYTLN